MKKWALPIFLGAVTFALLLLLLVPSEPPKVKVVAAARDLGAGTIIQTADLTLKEVPKDEVPEGAVSDPSKFVGKTLAVVRFKGEIITERHLGPAVNLAPDERAVAVKVTLDRGLAGLLRPGMRVGLVATLPAGGAGSGDIYAKAMLEGLRVHYIPPDFMASTSPQPEVVTAKVEAKSGGLLSETPAYAYQRRTSDEGVIVLSVSTRAMPVVYAPPTSTITSTTAITGIEGAEVKWVNPLELLAALNAEGRAITLYLLPEETEPFVTEGVLLSEMVNKGQQYERRVVYGGEK